MLRMLFAIFVALVIVGTVKADPVVFPLNLNAPVYVDLLQTPVVTVGTRTIDFTPNLNQQFIGFLFIQQTLPTADPEYRFTIGLRARDGLASLSGVFPLSPDPNFTNSLPSFPFGTANLILFDVIIAGSATRFSFSMTDVNGIEQRANFSTPVPEGESLGFLLSGLVAMSAYKLIRFRRRRY